MSIQALSRGGVALPKAGQRAPVVRLAAKQVDGFEAARPAPVLTLRRGATGGAVRAMQLKLVAKNYLSRSDFSSGAGVFGPRTETAVKRLQVEHGLPVTGVLDARSAAALNAERIVKKKESTVAEVVTDVFEKPTSLNMAAQTVTDDDDEMTVPVTAPLARAG